LTNVLNTGVLASLKRWSTWIDSGVFEDEYAYEYRNAEYEKAELLPTEMPDGPNYFQEWINHPARNSVRFGWNRR
jgi:hypothetical protein